MGPRMPRFQNPGRALKGISRTFGEDILATPPRAYMVMAALLVLVIVMFVLYVTRKTYVIVADDDEEVAKTTTAAPSTAAAAAAGTVSPAGAPAADARDMDGKPFVIGDETALPSLDANPAPAASIHTDGPTMSEQATGRTPRGRGSRIRGVAEEVRKQLRGKEKALADDLKGEVRKVKDSVRSENLVADDLKGAARKVKDSVRGENLVASGEGGTRRRGPFDIVVRPGETSESGVPGRRAPRMLAVHMGPEPGPRPRVRNEADWPPHAVSKYIHVPLDGVYADRPYRGAEGFRARVNAPDASFAAVEAATADGSSNGTGALQPSDWQTHGGAEGKELREKVRVKVRRILGLFDHFFAAELFPDAKVRVQGAEGKFSVVDGNSGSCISLERYYEYVGASVVTSLGLGQRVSPAWATGIDLGFDSIDAMIGRLRTVLVADCGPAGAYTLAPDGGIRGADGSDVTVVLPWPSGGDPLMVHRMRLLRGGKR